MKDIMTRRGRVLLMVEKGHKVEIQIHRATHIFAHVHSFIEWEFYTCSV
jgi:hypothetical protein